MRVRLPGSRSLSLALATFAVLAATVSPARAAQAAESAIEFEDRRMRAKEKEILTRYTETVGRWAAVQRVVQAVVAQNAREVTAEQIQAIDGAWQAGEDPQGLANELASNECAQVLLSLLAANQGYVEAAVSDARGALVCFTSRPSDYYQGDEVSFQRAFGQGAGVPYVSAPKADESLGLTAVQISVPVKAAGRAIGVLTVGRVMSGS
jgi:hypothetical protein